MSKTYNLGTREAVALAVIVVIAVFGTSVLFFVTNPLEVHDIRMHLGVNNYTGFNLDTDALYFGTIASGGSGTRDLILVNEDDLDKTVRVSLHGELAGWVIPAESGFTLGKHSNKTLKFTVIVPDVVEFGEYEGTIRFVFTPA